MLTVPRTFGRFLPFRLSRRDGWAGTLAASRNSCLASVMRTPARSALSRRGGKRPWSSAGHSPDLQPWQAGSWAWVACPWMAERGWWAAVPSKDVISSRTALYARIAANDRLWASRAACSNGLDVVSILNVTRSRQGPCHHPRRRPKVRLGLFSVRSRNAVPFK